MVRATTPFVMTLENAVKVLLDSIYRGPTPPRFEPMTFVFEERGSALSSLTYLSEVCEVLVTRKGPLAGSVGGGEFPT